MELLKKNMPANLVIATPHTAYWADKAYPCATGQGGIATTKQEGDGVTPVGYFPLRHVFYRPDRVVLETALPSSPLTLSCGWCDDPASPFYNQYVRTPFPSSHETLWREDDVYDIIVVVGYNDDPIIKGAGSAIFIHVARDGFTPTKGCVAFTRRDLIKILSQLTPQSHLLIKAC